MLCEAESVPDFFVIARFRRSPVFRTSAQTKFTIYHLPPTCEGTAHADALILTAWDEMVAVMNFVANELAGDQALDLGVR
jgi:hypothetical protein